MTLYDPFWAAYLPWIALFAGILWVAAAWYEVHHLVRYFQLEGYDSKRFLRWVVRRPRERGYALRTAAVMVGLGIFCWIVSERLPIVEGVAVLAVISGGVAFLNLVYHPTEPEIKQPFARTQRAIRLLATAFFLTAMIVVVCVYLLVSWTLRGYLASSNLLSAYDYYMLILQWKNALLYVMAGPFALLVAPLMLPFANLINWPIEEAFRQYYLSRARRYLKRSGATVIAITGSYGKTTTKHYLDHILEGRFRSLMTPKSFNTLLGISRVINDVLAKDVSYDYFIVETDAYFVGENARICRLVNPTIGMIMTVGPMHLERLGSMENIAKAQYEVVQALPPSGAAFFNGDDSVVREMAGRGYPQTTQFVTQKGVSGARLEALNIKMTAEGLDFDVRDNQTGEQVSMHAPLYGEHNVTNILMAAAVAHYLGMSLPEIAMRVTTLQPAEHRLIRKVMPDGTIIIDDSYSANPVGTKTALGVLGLHDKSHHRVVVSAGMFELGALSDQENRTLGERMAAVATDVILIGAGQTQAVRAGLDSANFPADHIQTVSSFNEAVSVYKGILGPGDTLLMLTDLPDTYAP